MSGLTMLRNEMPDPFLKRSYEPSYMDVSKDAATGKWKYTPKETIPDGITPAIVKLFPQGKDAAVGTVFYLGVSGLADTNAIRDIERCETIYRNGSLFAARVKEIGNHAIWSPKGVIPVQAGVFTQATWDMLLEAFEAGTLSTPWFYYGTMPDPRG